MFVEIPASAMTMGDMHAELASLEKHFAEFRADTDGHSGSPGEWMVERMDELVTEMKRRDPDFE